MRITRCVKYLILRFIAGKSNNGERTDAGDAPGTMLPVRLRVNKGLRIIFWILVMGITLSCARQKRDYNSEHFTYVVSGKIDSTVVQTLANTLENNYQRISRHLQTTPADPIQVFIYTNRLDYLRATGYWTALGNVMGPKQLHFLIKERLEKENKQLAVHEFAHAVTLQLLIDSAPNLDEKAFDEKFEEFPTWLWEGIACYEAGQFYHPRTLPYFTDRTWPTLEELNSRRGEKIYKAGFLLIEYILQRYGQDKLIDLIIGYGNLPAVLQVEEAEFERDWHAFVQKKYLDEPMAE